jgi:hypothetical protein
MNEGTITLTAIFFLLGWYSALKLAGFWLMPLAKFRVVWCAKTKSFSLVETEWVAGTEPPAVSVKNCLLWPEFGGCDGRCVK